MLRRALLPVLLLAAGVGIALWGLRGERDGAGDAAPPARPEAPDEVLPLRAEQPRLHGPQPGASAPGNGDRRALTRFEGSVVDAAGAAVSGALVEVHAGAERVATARSGEGGRYALAFEVTEAMQSALGVVSATGPDRTGAWGRLSFAATPGDAPPGDARRVPPLVLGPAQVLAVRVLSDCGAAPPARLWLASHQDPGGVVALPPTDAAGLATLPPLPAGGWSLLAAAAGCGRAWSDFRLPREEPGPLEIRLPAAHDLVVRVQDQADGSAIPGATVEIQERRRWGGTLGAGRLWGGPSRIVTDAQGVALVEGLGGDETLLLRAEAEGFAKAPVRGGPGPGVARVEPGQGEVTMVLARPMTVRWPIEDAGLGIPPDGTSLRLEPWTNSGRTNVPAAGRIEAGEVVVEGWGPDGASGYALAPGFGMARLQAPAGATVGHPTAFHALRRIEARAHHADGRPAAGWFLVVHDQGNNEVRPRVPFDAEGRAAMERLYGGPHSLVMVHIAEGQRTPGFALALGSVDLQAQDGRFEAVIPGEILLRIRATMLGAPVPAGFAGFPLVNGQAGRRLDDGGEPGLFLVAWRPITAEGTATVTVAAAGYLSERVSVAAAGGSGPLDVLVDLSPSGAVEVAVQLPADDRARVLLRPEGGTLPPFQQGQPPGPGGVVAFTNVAPGRYQAVEAETGLATEAFEVTGGGAPVRVALDLRAAGWVRGHVVVPEGHPFAGVTVGTEGAAVGPTGLRWPGMGTGLPGWGVNPRDGTFQLRVSGREPVTVRPYHATLRPDPRSGRVVVTAPRDDVVLTLVPGPLARLALKEAVPIRMNRGQPRTVPVRLYRGAVEGAGLPLFGTLDAEHLRIAFGGYEPGTWTVWIDLSEGAPLVLGEVVLGKGETDLGFLALPAGGTFRLEVAVRDGQSPPRFSVWLERLEEPVYVRSTDGAGSVLTVSGIGPGRFRVAASPYGGGAPPLHEEIVFDGASEVVRRIDAR